MQLKEGVQLAGLDIRMRPVLVVADRIWKEHYRPEGVTITSGLDGCHSPGSLHYYGFALDLRTRYFDSEELESVYNSLRRDLDFRKFDVIRCATHIHVEYDAIKHRSNLRWIFS